MAEYSVAQIREIVSDGLKSGRLSAWERGFLENVDGYIVPKGQYYQLTEKQQATLVKIEQKLYEA